MKEDLEKELEDLKNENQKKRKKNEISASLAQMVSEMAGIPGGKLLKANQEFQNILGDIISDYLEELRKEDDLRKMQDLEDKIISVLNQFKNILKDFKKENLR